MSSVDEPLLSLPVPVGPPTVTINRDDRVLVSDTDGSIRAAAFEGFFARDTRFVSGYELRLNGKRPLLLNSSPVRFFSARYEFTNAAILDSAGAIEAQSLSLRLDRTMDGGVHEDYDIVNYGRRTVALTLEILIESDFADLFEVKSRDMVRRGTIDSFWDKAAGELRTAYASGGFQRELVLSIQKAGSPAQYANGRLIFDFSLAPKECWHMCLEWLAVVEHGQRPTTLGCSTMVQAPPTDLSPTPSAVRLDTPSDAVRRAWAQAVNDMAALRLEDATFEKGVFVPAAGIPWFLTLFGRDALIVGMFGIGGFPEFAAGAIRRLSELQATGDDPERDMEPGKILHEVRHGELVSRGLLPHSPYYGTHDATSLFLIVISYLFHWTGERSLITRYLANIEAALGWLDRSGDRDGDGFQEYATRSAQGHYNQGWKDAGDAIPAADGTIAQLPLALCELQGYAYEAKLRMANLYEFVDRAADAQRLREEASELFERFNDRFWWDAEGTYYLGLDGNKRPIESVASNAGHLLQSGIVPADRARRMAERLVAPDMWSGWGIRTLSSAHPAYNPFAYQTGSVWPHDNAFIAGGMRRYGRSDLSAKIAKGLFDASARFQATRLPELWAGLPRDEGSFPVQYIGANVPQAWASASIFRLIAVLCGLDARVGPDGGRLYIDPSLPDWLPELTITNLRVGQGAIALRIRNGGFETLDNTSGWDVVAGYPPRWAGSPADTGTEFVG